jgi:hypothetical protein
LIIDELELHSVEAIGIFFFEGNYRYKYGKRDANKGCKVFLAQKVQRNDRFNKSVPMLMYWN